MPDSTKWTQTVLLLERKFGIRVLAFGNFDRAHVSLNTFNRCNLCAALDASVECPGCHGVMYCSEDHLRQHSRVHRTLCNAFTEYVHGQLNNSFFLLNPGLDSIYGPWPDTRLL
eukprot:TRINITY_DN34936_c0_g1_i1.p1 TRINITY_DN34936_c0_g1~~TRINITY_DN34936_c0_g1_i1.p1  ORF type:complete len:133 (+),score=7.16 TRINITY_DN34936_c0_g1_i1:58-399(+)